MIKTIDDHNFNGQKALVRVDFNVPMNHRNEITDGRRILKALPTIDKIKNDGGIPIIVAHLGRPNGMVKPKYSLRPVANYLEDLGYSVVYAHESIGEEAVEAVQKATVGDIVMLENVRYHIQETDNDPDFCKSLASLADVYVNDAFGTAHRAHASTYGVAKLFKDRFCGYLLEKEIEFLGRTLENPTPPVVAIIGGAKISGKINVIEHLFGLCDTILIGGGMMFTFYKAMGYEIGGSILESQHVQLANKILDKAKELGKTILLPTDVVVARSFRNDTEFRTVNADMIDHQDIGMDIGINTQKMFAEIIQSANTVIWNGPMGVFEMKNFAKGTYEIAKAMAKATKKGAITIVGGGDSASAVKQLKFVDKVSHVSTGGGASLEFLEGKTLPGVEALEN